MGVIEIEINFVDNCKIQRKKLTFNFTSNQKWQIAKPLPGSVPLRKIHQHLLIHLLFPPPLKQEKHLIGQMIMASTSKPLRQVLDLVKVQLINQVWVVQS